MVIHLPASPGQDVLIHVTMMGHISSTSLVDKMEENTHALLIMVSGVQTARTFLSLLKVSFD